MAWSYRKRIKIAPGVSINLSKSGVSTSLGPKGAKVTFSPKGTYLHTSIPGTGIYSRKKIGSSDKNNYSESSLSTLGSFQSPSLKEPKQPSDKKGCLPSFIKGLFILCFLASLVMISLVDNSKKELSSKESLYNELYVASSEDNTSAINGAVVSNTESNLEEAEGPVEISIPTEIEMSQEIEKIKKNIRAQYIVFALFLVLLLFSAVWLLKQSSFHKKRSSSLMSDTSKTDLKKGGNKIDRLRGIISSTDDPLKKCVLNNYLGHLINQNAEKHLKPSVVKWQRKVDRNPIPENEDQLKFFKEQYDAAISEAKQLMIDFDTELTDKEQNNYKDFCDAFQAFKNCSKTWRILSTARNTEWKSSAYETVQKAPTSFKTGCFPYLTTSFKVPVFPSASNTHYYYYPRFVIQGDTIDQFEVYSLDSISFRHTSTRFIEEGIRPSDSKQVDTTYRYVNKNGGPDRRYSNNPTFPVLLYGDITIHPFGDTFQVSNNDAATRLANAFRVLKDGVISSFVNREVFTPASDGAIKKTISEQYFYDLLDATNRLLEFGDKLVSDSGFCGLVGESISGKVNLNGEILSDPKDKLPIYLWADVINCYSGLGHGLDLSTNEGLGIVFFNTLRANRDFPMNYHSWDIIKDPLIGASENFTRKTLANMSCNNDIFMLEVCLKKYDKQLHNQYVVLLYRFASFVAKADKKISSTEAAWLNKIMALKEPEGEEDLINPIKSVDKPQEKTSPRKPRSHALKELNSLIGLTSVKTEINTLTNYIKVQNMRAEKGMKVSPVSYHCVFTGNPGTGKTTVARIVSEIYKELGVLKKGHLIETDRSGLVAEYVGQTAVKTNKIIDSALDGVLFIDEAYSLVDGGQSDYGKEAISTLLKRMEDDRDRLVVILAGYTEDMKRFINSNPGLQSRFNRYIEFPDYSADELFQIFESSTKKYEYKLTDTASAALKEVLDKAVEGKDKNFGNGRYVRNLFERVVENQANRISMVSDITAESLATIEEEDIKKSL